VRKVWGESHASAGRARYSGVVGVVRRSCATRTFRDLENAGIDAPHPSAPVHTHEEYYRSLGRVDIAWTRCPSAAARNDHCDAICDGTPRGHCPGVAPLSRSAASILETLGICKDWSAEAQGRLFMAGSRKCNSREINPQSPRVRRSAQIEKCLESTLRTSSQFARDREKAYRRRGNRW